MDEPTTDAERVREAIKWFDDVDRLLASISVYNVEGEKIAADLTSGRGIQEDLERIAERLEQPEPTVWNAVAVENIKVGQLVHAVKESDDVTIVRLQEHQPEIETPDFVKALEDIKSFIEDVVDFHRNGEPGTHFPEYVWSIGLGEAMAGLSVLEAH